MAQGARPMLCDDLEEWNRVGVEEWNGVAGGKEAQEGGDMCVLVTHMVKSPPAMQET